MNTRMRNGLLVAGVMVLPVALMTSAQGQEAADVTIRGTSSAETPAGGDGGDVVEDRSRVDGSWEFLREGVLMKAPAGEDRAGVYWEYAGQGFPTSASLDWTGTAKGQPGDEFTDPAVVIFFDTDPSTPDTRDALLVEDIYGGDASAWLAGEQSEAAKAAAPNDDPNGGSGSQWFGPLDEWAANLDDVDGLVISSVGVNLSTEGDGRSEGLLRSVTLGDDTYTFTSDEVVTPDPDPVRRDVNGGVSTERDGTSLDITMSSQDEPADSVVGSKLRWRIAVVGESSSLHVQGFDEVDQWSRRFRPGTGAYTVRVFKNGDQVRQITVRTGR